MRTPLPPVHDPPVKRCQNHWPRCQATRIPLSRALEVAPIIFRCIRRHSASAAALSGCALSIKCHQCNRFDGEMQCARQAEQSTHRCLDTRNAQTVLILVMSSSRVKRRAASRTAARTPHVTAREKLISHRLDTHIFAPPFRDAHFRLPRPLSSPLVRVSCPLPSFGVASLSCASHSFGTR
jgi:hypothetical protein